jgi:hypothetical protein
MMQPVFGQKYSRPEISKMLGGSIQTYLPHKDGQVLCGCFDTSPKYNPDAPTEVLYGAGSSKVQRMAEMVRDQHTAIPVFLRHKPRGRFEYVGDYLCTGLRTDPALLKSKQQQYPQRVNGVGGVLYFRKV